jgi:hypothetical protein
MSAAERRYWITSSDSTAWKYAWRNTSGQGEVFRLVLYAYRRNDRITEGGGTPILVRRGIVHHAVPVLGLQHLEATTIVMLDTKPIKCLVACLSPTHTLIISDLSACLCGEKKQTCVIVVIKINASSTGRTILPLRLITPLPPLPEIWLFKYMNLLHVHMNQHL